MRATTWLPILLLVASACGAAAQDLPIVPGRYSTDSCARVDPASTRYFRSGITTTSNENCAVTIKAREGKVYHAHIACHYKQGSPSEDEIALKVDSPSEVTWINQCTAIVYHLCAP